MTERKPYTRPFFGKMKVLIERINSLEGDWYVEFWEESYFCLGIEVFTRRREVVRIDNPDNESSRKTG